MTNCDDRRLRHRPGSKRSETERTRLQIEADERIQERADRIYLDTVHRHTDPDYQPGLDKQ